MGRTSWFVIPDADLHFGLGCADHGNIDVKSLASSPRRHSFLVLVPRLPSMRAGLRRSDRDDLTKQLMVESLLDDLTGTMAGGTDNASSAAQAAAIGSILAAVRMTCQEAGQTSCVVPFRGHLSHAASDGTESIAAKAALNPRILLAMPGLRVERDE